MPIEPRPEPKRVTLRDGRKLPLKGISVDPASSRRSFRVAHDPASESSIRQGARIKLDFRGVDEDAVILEATIDGPDFLVAFEPLSATPPAAPGPGRVRVRGSRTQGQGRVFERLVSSGDYVFRGERGSLTQEVMRAVGVGPKRQVLDALCRLRESGNVTNGLLEAAAVLAGNEDPRLTNAFAFEGDPLAQLCQVTRVPGYAPNSFSIFEHVAPPEQINSVDTSDLFISTTFSPQIAVLYAHRIFPDRWNRPNTNPIAARTLPTQSFVAVMDANGLHPTEMPLVTIAGTNFSIEEINRRLSRDCECLQVRLLPCVRIIELETINPNDYFGSLDRAAQSIIDSGFGRLLPE